MSIPFTIRWRMLCAILPSLALLNYASAASFNWNNPDGGAMSASLNWSPVGVPGPADTANLLTTPTLSGFMQLTLPANQAIGAFVNGHFAQNTIEGPGVLTLQTGGLSFTDSITEAPDEALDSLFINATINGAAGLTKNGAGFVRLGASNLYSGGTVINAGGVTATADANFGAAGSTITLNGGTIRAGSSFISTRPISLGINGGRIESFGNLTLNGIISGSGQLNSGRFTGGQLTLGGVNNYSGATNIDNGSTVNLMGRITSGATVRIAGTLNVGSASVGMASNPLSDVANHDLYGGRLNLFAPSSTTTETIGNLNLVYGTSTINLEPNANAGMALTVAALNRSSRSTAFVRGRDLGNGALAANRAILNVTNTATVPLIGGGGTTATNDSIIPFLIGNANTTGGVSPASVVDAGFVTRTTNGLRILDSNDYATTLGVAANDNVRITNSMVTRNTAATMNSLLIRDTLASGGPSGIQGTGALTITSGALAAVSDLAGEELSIDNPIAFGSEAIIHLAPTSDGYSGLTLNGALSGTGGLTKSGSGELTLTGTSSISGPFTINAGLVNFTGSATTGSSSLGSDTTITINAGSSDNQYVGLRAMTPLSTVSRAITIHQDAAANSLAIIGTLGGYGTNFSGPIVIEGGYLNLLGDTDPQVLTFSGSISGAGGLREPNLAMPLAQALRITGSNSYTLGTVIRIGRWEVGSNSALGSGRVYFTGDTDSGSIVAFGAARTLANPLVFRASPTFGGSNALTFTGSVDLGSVARDVTISNTADTTFGGVVSRGGIAKYGSGRLVLSGANTYNGQTIIVDGNLRAANSGALGAATGSERQATFIAALGALELSGSISSGEYLFFGANGLPITSARSDGNLRSVSGNNTLTAPIAFDNIGTVGIDAGGTLTLTSDTNDNTADLTARLRKVGAGTLNVRNVRLPGLQIDAGQVRVSPSGIPAGTSRVSSLTIAAGATLDLTNNALILDYASPSPLASVQSMLQGGKILTSVATPGAAVGFAEASRLFTTFPANFAAQSVDSTTVLLIQTLKGDTNLDRTVNFDDLLKLAQNYNLTGKTWADGDSDYNGAVNFDDLLALAQNYGGTVTLTQLTAAAGGQFASDWTLAMGLVPEPSLAALLATGAALARRRRFVR